MEPLWRKYEKDIFGHYKYLYPNCEISFNKKITGKVSGSLRQIDIFICGTIAGFQINIAIDCKNYNKKVDIKVVESFLGLMKDINCNKGIIVTQKGFTSSAYRRALNDHSDLELRILNFEQLLHFNGFGFVAYNLPFGVYIPIPMEWTFIDAYPIPDPAMCAFLFPSILGLEGSFKNQNFMAIKIAHKKDDLTLNNLLKVHERQSIANNPKSETNWINLECKNEALNCILSKTHSQNSHSFNETLYIEYDQFILLAQILSTSDSLENDSLSLRYIANISVPVQMEILEKGKPVLAEIGHAVIGEQLPFYRALTKQKKETVPRLD
jgi:hypothetical protein